MLNPSLASLGEIILRIQRELFVVGAELATTPDAWDRLEDGRTRVSADMVDGLTTLLEDLERRIEMPREFVVPGETTDERRARAGPDDPAPSRAPGGRARALGLAPRTAPATVSEPSGGPRLGPGPGGRAGGGADQHPRPEPEAAAAPDPSRRISRHTTERTNHRTPKPDQGTQRGAQTR